jgi:gluconolactonase
MNPSGRANGLMFDARGRLYACQGGERRVVRIDGYDPAELTVLADRFEGKRFNSPNDLALDAHGGVYFTDPRYGGGGERELDVMGVYYVSKGGAVTRVIGDLKRPNGILVSPKGRYLFVAEPDRRQVYRYEITGPGKLAAKTLIFTGDETLDGGGPDGMAHDIHGNVYATYRGMVILRPDGTIIGRIPVPEKPSNCTFGGPDHTTLYITARTSLYALAMAVPGMVLPTAGSTQTVKARDLELTVPQDWKVVPTKDRFRAAQFAVPGEHGKGELVVYYFGPRGAGDAAANVKRWIGQFAPEGRTASIARGTCRAGTYTLVDITGTYNQPIGPPMARRSKPVPGSRMLAAAIRTETEWYYLKLTGPQATVGTAAQAFRQAFGAKLDGERKVSIEEL